MDISARSVMNAEAFAAPVATTGMSSSLLTSFYSAWQNDPRAVWSSFSMIVVSEIGDKTFLIAAILAMRQSRTTVFAGAFAALALMSILSAFMGVVLPTLLPRSVTTLMAAVLFLVFGVKMLRDATQMTGEEMGEEWEEAKREVEEEEGDEGAHLELGNMEEGNGRSGHGNGFAAGHRTTPSLTTSSRTRKPPASLLSTERLKDGTRNLCGLCFSPVFAHAFILTFLGEWGDRSQIATIALAAAHNIWLVAFGTIAGHFLCTGMAVIGGRWIATRISVKHVTLGGAVMFILFGLIYAYESFSEARTGSVVADAAALQGGIADTAALAANADLDGLPPSMDGLGNALRRSLKWASN